MNKNNIVKETCQALNIKFKELAQLMGVHDVTPAQWSSKGNIPESAQKFMQILQDYDRDKKELEKIKEAIRVVREII